MSDYTDNQEEEEQTSLYNQSTNNNLDDSVSLLILVLKVLGLKIIAIVLIVGAIFLLAGVAVTSSYYLTNFVINQKKQEEKKTDDKKSFDLGKITLKNKNEIKINGQTFFVPLVATENKNLFYALATIRFAEAYRADSVYSPNDFLSCGNYQQMINELIGSSLKAQTAKSVMGSEYDRIIINNSVDILRWARKGYQIIRDGEIEFSPIYRGGSFVGWARQVQGMTAICRELTKNHLKTGLFDRIAIARLQEQGRIDYITNYDLKVNNLDNFVSFICRSQGPVDCGSSWNVRAKNALRSAINSNLYELVKN